MQCERTSIFFIFVCRNHGQTINSGMGVVIQKMVPAEQAGVLFTYDPVTSDCGTMVINSNFGVGEVRNPKYSCQNNYIGVQPSSIVFTNPNTL